MASSREGIRKLGKLMSSSLREVDSYQRQKRTRAGAVAHGFVAPLVLQMFFFSSNALPGRQGQQQQEEKKPPLGSLTATGDVYVNERPTSAETTIFGGDALRTGETGTAIFTMSGNGALKIGPQTQVLISGDPKFAGELKSGTVVIASISGPSGIKLRAGSAVVVPAVRSQVTAAKIERQADGSFLVTCLEGQVSAIPLQGTSGQLLDAGQSVSISPGGELVAHTEVTVKPSAPSQHAGLSHTGWTLVGAAGGAGGIAAAAMGHRGGKHSVSPSVP